MTLERDAGWPINYVGPAGSFFTISSDQLAALGDAGAEAPATDNPFRGRIVLVGGTFPEGRDTYQTPYGPMPGVEVHANVAHMLTTGRFIRPSSWLGRPGRQRGRVARRRRRAPELCVR